MDSYSPQPDAYVDSDRNSALLYEAVLVHNRNIYHEDLVGHSVR